MIELILILTGLIGLLIGSFTDIETREVPNWLNFSLIASGLGLRIIGSLVEKDISIIGYGVLGLILMILLGNLLYYSRQWGGGDTKLLIGLGGLFGSVSIIPFFLFHFIVNLVVIGSVYGILWSVYLAIRHHDKFRKSFTKTLRDYKYQSEIFLSTGIAFLIVSYFMNNPTVKIMTLVFGILSVVYIILMIFIRTVESSCMFRKVRVSALTEGDWIAQDVIIGSQKIYKYSDPGVSISQINLMKKFNVGRVLIKEGIPFVPSFLITFLITLWVGNVFSVIL